MSPPPPGHQTLTLTALTVLVLVVTVACSHAASSPPSSSFSTSSLSPSSSSHRENAVPPAPTPVAAWIRDSALPTLSRSKRSRTLPWEWTIDALKCSLKIMSVQVSHYHNNELMCCGLWKIKSIIKQSAHEVCDHANNSVAVFDEMINEDLIYSSFSKSLLGDETLDCAAYPEGSPVCDQLWRFIWFIFVLMVLILLAVIVGSCVSCYCCFYWRNRYRHLVENRDSKYVDKAYHKAGSESDVSDASSTNNNKPHKKGTAIERFLRYLGFSGSSPGARPVATYSPEDRHALTTNKDGTQVRSTNGTQASLVANGASGQTTPTDRCSSAASTSSSTVPSHKDDPV